MSFDTEKKPLPSARGKHDSFNSSSDNVQMSSQTCLNGQKHVSFTDKLLNGAKQIWSTRQTQAKDSVKNNDLLVKTTIRELIIYIIFLIILCILTFGMTSPINYYYNNVMNGLFTTSATSPPEGQGVDFAGIGAMQDFWDVLNGPILDAIYWETWYNGDNVSSDQLGSIYYESKVLGVPRLRQIRVKKDSCVVHSKFKDMIANCYAEYSDSAESKSPFSIYESNQTSLDDSAYFYQSSRQLDNSNYGGVMATYGGGGYIKNLKHTKDESAAIIASLSDNLWIDRGTRAVFLDLTVYNANINLFCQIKLLVEFPATGGAISSSKFTTVKLIRYVTSMDYFVLACEVMFAIFIVYYTVEEALEIRIHKLKYFTESIWNILDIVVILISYVCIIFNIYRMIKVDSLLEQLLSNSEIFPNFEFLCYWQTQFNNGIALTVFLSWIKIFKYISFNKTMNQLSSTLGKCAKDVLGFAVMFYIVFFAYAQLGYLLFGSLLEDYSTFITCLFTLFRIILGDFDFVSLESASKILGPIYFITYVFFVFFVLLNMFLAIINDTYSEVKEDISTSKSDIELGEFFKKGYEKMLTKLNVKRDRIIDIQDALKTADKNGDNKLNFDELRVDLKNRGYTDIEIEAFFAQYDADGDKCLDLSEQNQINAELDQQAKDLDQEFNEIKYSKDALDAAEEDDETRRKANVVSFKEFGILTKRVDNMESSIGNIVSRIDTVLGKLESIEKSKLKRREAMARILDTFNSSNNMNDEEKKKELERLIKEELQKWDEPSASRAGSANTYRPSSGYKP